MSWDELVAAALVGTDRRPVEPGAPPGAPEGLAAALRGRGEDGLLAAAAAWTVARRAGAVAGPALAVIAAGQDDRPLCPPEAAARLSELLEEGARLVGEWLALAAARGVRPPPELVPALLDWAAPTAHRQPLAAAAAGPLGAWLAEREPRWRFVPGADDPAAVWADGAPAARRVLLVRLRTTDPAAARELLERTFAEESAEDRAAFVEALAHGLSDADEPLLERALDDRRQAVRTAAAELLARLPRSRFAARMAERAAPLLTLRGRRIEVALPGEPDAVARRDGIGRGARRADALAHILSRAPLATWTERFGRSPEKVLRLSVADDFEALVHGALTIAAEEQQDAGWARALWRVRPQLGLLDVLPKEEREARAAAAPDVEEVAAGFPPPWGRQLSEAVVRRLRKLVEAGETSRIGGELAHGLDPAVLGELEALREAGGRPVARLWDTLAIRAAMLRELS